MKKSTLLLMVLCMLTIQLSAQHKNPEKEKEAARLATKPSTISLETLIQQKSDSYVITNENVSKASGIRHVYLRQAINGMEVYGTESSVHFDKTGKVIAEHNKFLADVQTTLKGSSQGINARAAISSVANQMGYKVSNLQEVKSIGGKNKAAVFNRAGISLVEIPAKLMYYYKEGVGTQLIWELSIAETTSSDWWNFRVDASTGKIIDKDNWTVSCNIMDAHNEHFHSGENVAISTFIGPLNEAETAISHNEASMVSEGAAALVGGYRVYAMPLESPNHGSMTRTLVNNPDDAIASPFGWHDTNGSAGPESTLTTGNNADVHKGSDRPDGTASLIFDFPIDLNQNPALNTAPYITNLFYWNNITHDVMYHYGFDEVSGNFQENNYGNGGAGSDSVNVNAQASGNCNANFGTPADGGNPTMNMYLCNNSTPSHDSGLDAGVIVHEYGHGISNRLTGGPGNSGCLSNGEQMGEGWSDFYGLLLTIESGDTGTDARGVGTYLLGQPVTGLGVRTQKYSTDFAVNDHTYDDIKTSTAVHYRGEVWATMLWDMTWGIIGTDGFDTDFYNGTGGNNVALAIVTEGLKLQPCSPGFVDGRDAILAADQALYGGAHLCTIWEAFARRGLGYSASQGSSSSNTDGTEAFDLPPTFSGLDAIDEVCLSDGIQSGLSGGNPTGGIYSGPGVTDDGNGTTFTFDPSVGGPGLVTVTYTVNDFCTGAPTAITDDINVTNDPPEIVCMGSGLIPMNGSSSINPGTTISDNTTITSTLTVTDNVSITDLNVDLNINHTWVGDLVITLESPAGTVITILDPGTCSGDDVVILLDDEAPTTSSACYGTGTNQAYPDPSYQPFSPLSVFDGENTAGDWILSVSDTVGGDTGILNGWGLNYDYEVTAPILDVTLDGSGNATVNAEDLLFSVTVDCGGYSVLAGSPLAATVSFTCSDTGLNTVAVQVTNDSGAIATCSAIVNVIGGGGGGGPFTCPGDITQDNDPGICGAVVTYTVESPTGCGGSGPLATGIATLELVSSAGGTGNRSGVSYNPSTDRYYSVNAGSGGYPIDCFDGTTGAIISSIASGFDYRGAWWNSNLNQSEGNGYDAGGIVVTDLAGDCPDGTTTPILPVNQPDSQSCGDLDYDNNEIIYYNAGSITQVDRATGITNGTLALSGVPGGSVYAVVSVGYTGVVGYEYAIYDNTTQSVHLYDRATGAYAATSSIGLTTTNFGFAYENDQAWVYANDRWNGFTIFGAPSGTITQTAGLASGEIFPVGTTTNTFEYDDGINPVQTCSFDVTINDAEAPVITCPGDITVDNDPGTCGAVVDYTVTATDNCSSTCNISQLANTLTFSGWDGSGSSFISCSTSINDITIYYNSAPNTDLTLEIFDGADPNTSTSIYSQLVPLASLTTGANTIVLDTPLAITQGNPYSFMFLGNTDGIAFSDDFYADGNLIAFNGTYDIFSIYDLTFELNVNGGSLTVNQTAGLPSGSTFPVGTTTNTFVVTDGAGNTDTCSFDVTVNDAEAPVANCAAAFTIQLDANGMASITAADVDNGSTDNCNIASTSIDVTDFTCADVGPNTVTLTVTDDNGNSSTCTTVVTVQDNVAPTAVCQNITVFLDATGNVSIVAGDVDGGSTDACGIASTSIDIADFTCADIGPNNVTLTVTDVNGNTSTCVAVVTVEDNLPPIIACPADITVNTDAGMCSAIVTFPMPLVLDNCSATATQTGGLASGSAFPVGVNTVEFTATDGSGNTAICSFIITVEDNEAPTMVCQNITIQLDASGNASITAADVDGGSSDNCGIASISVSPSSFDCSDVGDNPVVLTVTDIHGNSNTCTAIVTVEDITPPVAVCQNITVELDPITGTVTITGADVDGGSTDACGIDTYSLDIDTFDCSNIGDNTVVLTVTDVNGNVSTCTAIVTVEDNTSPMLVCQDFTIEIGADGTATLAPSDVIASNDDACGILTVAVDITEFTCADIGTPVTVQIFSQDNNGNLSTCTAVVTAVDLLAPVLTCPADQTVDPGAGNLFYIVPDYFGTGAATAIDNCTDPVTITTQDPAAGTPLPDGVYTITLTATDEYGNTSTCEFELTVESILGVGDNNANIGSVQMYPNPAKHTVTIGNPASLSLENLRIFDIRGRMVKTIDLRNMGAQKAIDVSEMAAATYLVIIQGENGQITKRLIKE